MNRTQLTYNPIEAFPVPWADGLTDKLGAIAFAIESPHRTPAPSQWLGIVASHKSKLGFASQGWQDSLQSALQLANRQKWGILCAQDAPYFHIIHHACSRYSIPIRIIQIDRQADFNNSTQLENTKTVGNEAITIRLFLAGDRSQEAKATIPLHDRATVFLADHLFVLELKKGGKIAQLLEHRLKCDEIPTGSTYLSLTTSSSQKEHGSTAMDWLGRGAVGWLNTRTNAAPNQCNTTTPADQGVATYQPLMSLDLLTSSASKYLVHCTRSRRGPWPDQSIAQFHDELLYSPWRSQPTALDTLTRILHQRRLIATHLCRRGSIPTVCFSENSIQDLLAMHRFQSHLARWDWEPYGIMIDREWLIQRGAKKVTYVDPSVAKTMSADGMAFCQTVSSHSGSTDWREENEWRVPTDLRLNTIPFSKAVVFVSALSEAKELQRLSRWPIAIA